VAHFQQDGHMAMANPRTRANYEPNSWGPTIGGPREDPARGFQSFAAAADGPKQRLRAESFADHYSQARQFYISQEPIERQHIVNALVFELSKVERPDIRSRTVSHLLHIDAELAQKVARGLRLDKLPAAAAAARPPIADLPPSAALSIVRNGPQSFAGRKLGLLMGDGADADLYQALVAAAQAAGATTEVVAPHVGGVLLSDGSPLVAGQKIDGGPSVLYDAVAVLAGADSALLLAADAPAQDFVRDAYAHCKFIGLTEAARPLLEKAGLAAALDKGCIFLASPDDAADFLAALAPLRFWEREAAVDLDAR
jgi:catalase